MSYTKTNWQTGDVITAEKLNKIENGVEATSNGGVFIVEYTIEENNDEYTVTNASHTYAEIKQAITDGKIVVARHIYNDGSFENFPMVYCDASGDNIVFGDTKIESVDGTTNVVAFTTQLVHGFYEDADAYIYRSNSFILATQSIPNEPA